MEVDRALSKSLRLRCGKTSLAPLFFLYARGGFGYKVCVRDGVTGAEVLRLCVGGSIVGENQVEWGVRSFLNSESYSFIDLFRMEITRDFKMRIK